MSGRSGIPPRGGTAKIKDALRLSFDRLRMVSAAEPSSRRAPRVEWEGIPLLIMAGLLILATGCGRVGKEDLEKILAVDPGFREILQQKEELDLRIKEVKKEISRKDVEVKKKMGSLKNELTTARKEAELKIEALKSELDQERERIRRAIESLKSELRILHARMESLERMFQAVDKLAKAEEEAAPGEKRNAEWWERLNSLRGQSEELEEKIGQLKEKLKLRLLQLRLLRQ